VVDMPRPAALVGARRPYARWLGDHALLDRERAFLSFARGGILTEIYLC
jgi:hypothetical protein